MRSLLPLVALGVAAVACSSTSSSTGTTTSGSTALSACAWPADLDPPDSSGTTWAIGRTYLACDDGSDFVDCLSSDLVTCPGPNAIPGATITNCKDQCATDEYAVTAGGPPDVAPDGAAIVTPQPNIPASCHMLSASPGGWVTYCCACE